MTSEGSWPPSGNVASGPPPMYWKQGKKENYWLTTDFHLTLKKYKAWTTDTKNLFFLFLLLC